MMLKQATPAAAMPSSGPMTPSQLDAIVARLKGGAQRFAQISLDERIALARSMQKGYLRIARASAEAATKAKGLPLEAAGDEWGSGPLIVVRGLRLIVESLEALKRTGNTPIGPIARTKDGALTIRVFPANAIDGLLFKDVTVDVHMAVGLSESEMHEARASFYKRPDQKRDTRAMASRHPSLTPTTGRRLDNILASVIHLRRSSDRSQGPEWVNRVAPGSGLQYAHFRCPKKRRTAVKMWPVVRGHKRTIEDDWFAPISGLGCPRKIR
jgi:hypothetical protein